MEISKISLIQNHELMDEQKEKILKLEIQKLKADNYRTRYEQEELRKRMKAGGVDYVKFEN